MRKRRAFFVSDARRVKSRAQVSRATLRTSRWLVEEIDPEAVFSAPFRAPAISCCPWTMGY